MAFKPQTEDENVLSEINVTPLVDMLRRQRKKNKRRNGLFIRSLHAHNCCQQ